MSSAESRLSSQQVHILENRNLTHLRVPALRRHEVSVADGDESRTHESLRGRRRPDVRVAGGPEEGSPRAVVRYRPKLSELQKRLRSRHALQFVVEYDVDRKDVGGEVQVSMEQSRTDSILGAHRNFSITINRAVAWMHEPTFCMARFLSHNLYRNLAVAR